MPWNKTPPETLESICNYLRSYDYLTYGDIAKLLGVSSWLVSETARKYLTKDELEYRYSRINHYAKLGDQNPMFGKVKEKHHLSKETVIVSGYLTAWAPEWWTGLFPKGNRVYVHQRVWCEANNLTEVPKGCVIHHKDENKHNNSLDNLVCLTRREHAQIHYVSNILKRCNDYSDKEVESRTLEAQSLLLGE